MSKLSNHISRSVATVGAAVLALAAGALAPLSIAPAQTEPPFGMTERVPLEGVNFPLDPPTGSSGVQILRAFHDDLSFERPIYVAAAPGNNRDLFVVEQGGTIRRFVNSASTRSSSLFIDLRDRVIQNGGNEQGLLGLAFHPQYASNGYFYVYYIPAGGSRRAVLSRFRRSSSNPDVGDRTTETILLTLAQPQDFTNHNGGCLQFGPDGKIYIAVGDGGSANDPLNNAQNFGVPLGKLLRVNDDGSIPTDNPFYNKSGARKEIWALGLRNPWRFSFDSATGRLWLGDVGQNAREEVDVVRKGGNYGWRVYEAKRENINPDNLPLSAFDSPVFSYPRSSGNPEGVAGRSVTGGYVYRGSLIPALAGKYVFGDFIAGRVWALTQTDGVVGTSSLVGDVPMPASFGQDNDGNLYIASFDGHIYTLRATGGTTGEGAPAKLSQTGLFTDTASLTPNPGLIEYAIRAPFWSDSAIKRRWIGLDGSSQITFSADQPWQWPRKAVVVKHFEMDLADGTRTRLETRVLFNGSTGWRAYTYRWNSAQTDADLLPDTRTTVQFDALDPLEPDGVYHQTYTFPSRSDCQQCHTAVGGSILGPRTEQMNRDFRYPSGVTDNQLRAYNHIGLFTQDIGNPSQYGSLTNPANPDAALGPRARAYLATNCSQCHQPGGPTPVSIDLRSAATDAQLNAIGVRPTVGDLGLSDAYIIAPGSKERSVLWERIRRTDGTRMPPLGSHKVDREGLELIGQWIDSLPVPSTLPTLSFSASKQTVSESTTTVNVRVKLSAASTQVVTAPITLGGSAATPADYSGPTSVSIPAGATSVTLKLSIVNDSLQEGEENAVLTLGTPSNALLGSRKKHTVVVTDDDGLPSVAFSASTKTVTESVGKVTVRVNLSAASTSTVTVPISFSGTASNPADYTASKTTISIAPGATQGTLSLSIVNDTKAEADETVIMIFGTPTNATKGSRTKQTVTITDDD